MINLYGATENLLEQQQVCCLISLASFLLHYITLLVVKFSFPTYMNGNREHVRSITVQVATDEEEEQQEEEEARAHDEAAAMEADEAAARQWQQQAGHGHDLQEAAADAIAWMNEAADVAVARRNPNAEVAAAAAGFSWRNGAVAWKRIGLAWRIDAPLVADVAPEDGDGDGAVAEAAGAPAGSSSVAVELGFEILVFIVAALLCLIM